MAIATLRTEVARLRERLGRAAQAKTPLLDRLRRDPAEIVRAAGMEPDPWQRDILRSTHPQTLLLCSRQSGKSLTAAALAMRAALLQRSLVLLVSPTLRQSGELFRDKVLKLFNALGRPVPATRETALTLELANGSRVISLPGDESGIRGYSGVALLVIDEAARVPDALYCSVRPMLAVSRGRLVCLSTPFGKLGWFHDEWHGAGDWARVRITAEQCPRISPEFLAEERRALGDRWYRQEYLTEFMDVVDQLFRSEDVAAACADDLQPLFGGRP
jgi:hypothetical protein